MTTSDERFYAQRDTNFKERVLNILFGNSSGHSEQEALDLIANLIKGLEPKVIQCESNNKSNVTYNEVDYVEQCITEGNDYRDCVDTLVNKMGTKYNNAI
mgnify:CR=1 FL=1